MIGISFEDVLFDDESLQNTPGRVCRMMDEFKEWREWELDHGVFKHDGYNDLVIEKDIPFTSFCMHHVLPFFGTVSVAYLPCGYVVGLSKLARTVRKFASAPQIQEQLTHDIANYLTIKITDNLGVFVLVEARHMCQEMRGARVGGVTITSAARGKFLADESLKYETLKLMRH